MIAFDLTPIPRILFGRGKIAQLGPLARDLGAAALLIHNGDDPGKSGPVDRATASLQAAGVNVTFHRQRGEPTTTDIDAAVTAARAANANLLIAVGGGSAIDATKAVAGLLTNGGVALDYMEVIGKGQKITKPAMPWIAVPTTAGTGAEVTKNAVVGAPDQKFKASIRSEHLLARAVIVDPELGVATPPNVTAASGMDALCQCIEATTSTGANLMTSTIAHSGAIGILDSIKTAWENGADLEAREKMAYGALCSGIALTNAGLGAVHGFAAPIGANFPVPHGVVCARLLPAVVAANADALRRQFDDHPSLKSYESLGLSLVLQRYPKGNIDPLRLDACETLVVHLHSLVRDLQIPPLSNFGLREQHIPDMVALARKASSMRYNPVVLADDTLANILRSAL